MSRRLRAAALALATTALLAPATAGAVPALTVDLASGDVLYQQEATQPWYPASLTKLMTTYVALSAVREGRLTFDTPLVVSTRAAQMPPSKMGFVPGTQVTLGNALKMMMVKSANDIAITIAEGVSGSVEAFADEMNAQGAAIGLRQSHFANPNGLPDPRHFSSARDMAVIAQALYRTFPEQAALFSIGALSLDGQVIPNHNNLLGRYPGIDGMKTGFTCAAGFNVVATSTRGGRHLAAVVMGAPNVAQRTMKAAVLLDRGFAGVDTTSGSLQTLPSTSTAPPPDMRNSICHARGKAIAAMAADINKLEAPLAALGGGDVVPAAPLSFAGALSRPAPMAMHMADTPRPQPELTAIYVGPPPGWSGPVAQVRPVGKRGRVAQKPQTAPATDRAPATPHTKLAALPPAKPKAVPAPHRGPIVGAAKPGAAAKPVKPAVAGHAAKAAPKEKAAAHGKAKIAAKPAAKAEVGDAPASE